MEGPKAALLPGSIAHLVQPCEGRVAEEEEGFIDLIDKQKLSTGKSDNKKT